MSELTLQSKYEIKELQLNALLEITQAINSNMAEESLYKIYNFTLRSNLNIEKLALFVLDEEWECKVNFGTKKHFTKSSLLPAFKTIQDITHLKEFQE
jgi:sigma-B regulation protein RsbU (phosphoserine phosphatase)